MKVKGWHEGVGGMCKGEWIVYEGDGKVCEGDDVMVCNSESGEMFVLHILLEKQRKT